jgi:tetratricopeptide (TPR) repeat protein
MAQMTSRVLAVLAVLTLLCAGTARAQSPVPAAGLAAEGAGRWEEALRVYRAAAAADPTRVDLWVRIGDIEARRGNLAECIDAFQRAAQAAPGNASLYARLSQAYSVAGQPKAALDAIEGALALGPTAPEYLRARAVLATWIGDYERARVSYARLAKIEPDNVELMLAFARVSAWSGDTDESVSQYRRYLEARPDAADIWLELARAESWRGNTGGAAQALTSYRSRFGETDAYSRTFAAVMAGDRPRRAEDVLTPLLAGNPDSLELNVTRTIALAMQRRAREAFSSLETVQRLSPQSPDARNAERIVRTLLASTAEPQFTVYSDSDRLQVQRFAPRATVAFVSGTQLSAGYERTRLDARPGSGLEQPDGTPSAHYGHGWIGGAQRVGGATFDAQAGYATFGGRERMTYSVGAAMKATDGLWFAFHRTSGALVISPRTVGLGLTQIAHRAQVEWTPTLESTIALDGSYQEFSDGNHRLEFTISPRRSVARRAGFNLDLGLSAYRLETARDLSDGYYAPRRYEHYAFTAYPYFKVSENVGVSLSTALGAQRDSLSRSFRFGGTMSGEATFGIYEPWLLKINGSASMNRRLESGAFRGVSGGVVLVRRF